MIDILRRELVYIWYYFDIQFRQIFWYWVIGMAIGSAISVFAKDRIHGLLARMNGTKWGIFGIIPACLLGIASPLCMYGTIPIAASFSRQGMRHDWLGAFMMASILLNPQLIIYSAALGPAALAVRIISCFLCGCVSGLLLWLFYRDKPFFNFDGFEERASHDTDPDLVLRYIKNLWRNVKATGLYFLFGILLSAVFQRYVPQDFMVRAFGGNEAWGVLMAAAIGVPLYACGGGTIPLLQEWLREGMSMGSAAAF
ncbi:MAG: permease, partial [Oscillospiraceae bacterium]|nr:permease [Oscillospiraceae bacterium]